MYPTDAQQTYTTPAGWRYRFPMAWPSHEAGGQHYLIIESFTVNGDTWTDSEKNRFIKMDLAEVANEKDDTTESLLKDQCDEAKQDPPAKVLSCDTIEINGSRWGRAVLHTAYHGPAWMVVTLHATEDMVFSSTAYFWGDRNFGARLEQVDEIVASFVVPQA